MEHFWRTKAQTTLLHTSEKLVIFTINKLYSKIQPRLYTLPVWRCPVLLYLREGLNKNFIPLRVSCFQGKLFSLYTWALASDLALLPVYMWG